MSNKTTEALKKFKEKKKENKERQEKLKKLLDTPKEKKARKQIKAPMNLNKLSQDVQDKLSNKPVISKKLSFDQRRFLELFIPMRFNITNICAEVGISRTLYYIWLKEWPIFAESVKNLQEYLIDRSEEVLLNALDANDSKTAQFILKHLSDRYKEKIDITSNGHSVGSIINIITPKDEQND